MKLYLKDEETIPAVQYLADGAEDPEGYTETTDPEDWDKYFIFADVSYKDFRNSMISNLESSWGSYSDDQQKALIRNYIWPSETSDEDLDALYSDADRDMFRDLVMTTLSCLECVVRKSITADSTKFCDLQLADDGVMAPKEIKTDETF